MAYTQDDLDRIDRAIASGELSIYDGHTRVEYKTTAELVLARDLIRADLAAQARGASTAHSPSGIWGFTRVGSRL
jgi:hypothetical protein